MSTGRTACIGDMLEFTGEGRCKHARDGHKEDLGIMEETDNEKAHRGKLTVHTPCGSSSQSSLTELWSYSEDMADG